MFDASQEAIQRMFCENRFTAEEKNRFHTIIQAFTRLYYDFPKQTWAATKWRGVQIFKAPTDMWVYQELIHEIRPDLIIETGTCRGGSALYMADLLRLEGLKNSMVLTIDIDGSKCDSKLEGDPNIIREIGSSVSVEVFEKVKKMCEGGKKVMVILDSDHSKEHVMNELAWYGPLVSVGSILIVEDTIVNGNPVMADHGPGPKEALDEWHVFHPEFEVNLMCEKFMLTFNRGGYLERKA